MANSFLTGSNPLTYGELFERIDRLSAFLHRAGMRRDDRLIIATRNDRCFITCFFAALYNGITVVPFDFGATPSEARALVGAADPHGAVIDSELIETWALAELLASGTVVLTTGPRPSDRGHRWDKCSDYLAVVGAHDSISCPALDAHGGTMALIMFTSGTTSKPKGVELTHRNLMAHTETLVRQYGLDHRARILNPVALHHVDGLVQGPLMALMASGAVCRTDYVTPRNLSNFLDLIPSQEITHLVTVPDVLTIIRWLGTPLKSCFEPEHFRFIISTAAHLDERLWRDLEEMIGKQIVNAYGLTETVAESLFCGPNPETRKVGTVGKPVDCEARIVDEQGRNLPQGEVGELALRGEHIMRGYFRDPQETTAVVKDGWFYTGDLAKIDEEGFYTIVGRKKNVIKVTGISVYAEDVTAVLRQIPGVLDAITFGMPDETWGEKVVSCVILQDNTGLSSDDIIEVCVEKLSSYKVPRHVFIFDRFPRGPAGKILINDVRRRVAAMD